MILRNLFSTAIVVLCCTATLFAQDGKTKPQKDVQKPVKEKVVLTPKMVPEAAETSENLDMEAFKPKPIDTLVAPTVIAFGSCNKMDKPQTMWEHINANNPNLWIWLGDIIYADTTNPKALSAKYKTLKTNPDYKKLRTKAQVVGIYDDHDYGKYGGDQLGASSDPNFSRAPLRVIGMPAPRPAFLVVQTLG